MKTITLARKPLSEGTVTKNVLEHGSGGLNIDAARIESPGETISTHSQSKKAAYDNRKVYGKFEGDMQTHQTEGQKLGRFPTNLILQHLDGCRCDGVKKVKASAAASGPSLTGKSTSNSRGVFNGVESTPCYSGEDGKETVANWICEDGCPVKALDEQSGVLKSGQHTTYGKMYERRVFNPASEGGASRFFKQVKP